jgi:hypothetical protein
MDVESNPGPPSRTPWENISLCNVNIRSIKKPGRFEAAKLALAGKHDIIAMTETWLLPEHEDKDLELPGYVGPYRLDRPAGHGGVMAWVSDSIVSKRRKDLEISVHETMWLDLTIKNTKILLAVVYRQQDGDYALNYWDKLQETYDKAKASGVSKILLTGDFNADVKTNIPAGNALFNFLTLNHLTQHVQEPTRVTPEAASILDLVITNHSSLISGIRVESPVHTNDHRTVIGLLNLKVPKVKSYKREMWEFKGTNFDQFRDSLEHNDWSDCLNSENIDEACSLT